MLDLANSLGRQREQIKGCSVEGKGDCDGLEGLVPNKGIGSVSLRALSHDAKGAGHPSCGEGDFSKEGRPSKDLEGVKVVGSDNSLNDLSFQKFVSFSEFLGFLVEGFEKEVESLLRKLEVRKGRKVVGSSVKRKPSSASHAKRVLQKLECFANFNQLGGKGRRCRKNGWESASSGLASVKTRG